MIRLRIMRRKDLKDMAISSMAQSLLKLKKRLPRFQQPRFTAKRSRSNILDRGRNEVYNAHGSKNERQH